METKKGNIYIKKDQKPKLRKKEKKNTKKEQKSKNRMTGKGKRYFAIQPQSKRREERGKRLTNGSKG